MEEPMCSSLVCLFSGRWSAVFGDLPSPSSHYSPLLLFLTTSWILHFSFLGFFPCFVGMHISFLCFLSSPKDIFSLLLQRKEGGERNTCEREDWLVVSVHAPPGDRMGRTTLRPTKPHRPGQEMGLCLIALFSERLLTLSSGVPKSRKSELVSLWVLVCHFLLWGTGSHLVVKGRESSKKLSPLPF